MKAVLKRDSRNRIALTKLGDNLATFFKAYWQGKKIVLEPIPEVHERERWLYEPKNKELVKKVKKAFKQKAKHKIDLAEFEKNLK